MIDAQNNSKENLYIESLQVNGQESPRNYLKHADLLQGGTIEFKMGSHPLTSTEASTMMMPLFILQDEIVLSL